jgi:transposase-like protein
MNDPVTERERRRRSPAEVAAVVAAYDQSGLSRTEYCRQHGLSLSTLNRHRKGAGDGSGIKPGAVAHAWSAVPLIPVEVIDSDVAHQSSRITLYIELAGGRRVGVRAGFDAETLRRLIAVLEAA